MKAGAKVLSQLGAKQGLQDPRYFVGRGMDAADLQACAACTGSGWIHGPRRLGKTSLAHHLASEAREQGRDSVFVDAGDLGGARFDELLIRIIEEAQRKGTSAGDPRARFEALGRTSRERPLLVIIDEFDRLAVDLRMEEQAFLRRVASDARNLQYLFVSRSDPYRLVEEVPEVQSRLLGICTARRVKPLERRDVQGLCALVLRELGLPNQETLADRIWRQAGGHTVAVRSMLHAVVAALLNSTLDWNCIEDAWQDRGDELGRLAVDHWKDLSPTTRAALLRESGAPLSRDETEALRRDGLTAIRGQGAGLLLLEAGNREGIVPSPSSSDVGSGRPFAQVERIQALMYEINSTARRLAHSPAFQVTDEILKVYHLSRSCEDEASLGTAAIHLYKLLYEGGREPKGEKAWRMPVDLAKAFRTSKGIEAMETLRHLHCHDPGARSSPVKVEQRFQEVGDLYESLCGKKNPCRADWRAARNTLLAWVQESLDSLLDGYRSLEHDGTVS